MKLCVFLWTVFVSLLCLGWCQTPNISTQRPLTQYEQFMLQRLNAINGRNVATSAFVLTNGIINVNDTAYIWFTNEQLNYNAFTIPGFGAFRARLPGLYYFYFTVTGNGTAGVTVNLYRENTRLTTAISRNGQPDSKMALTVVETNESVYLQIQSGELVNNANNEENSTVENSFSGVYLASAVGNTGPVLTSGIAPQQPASLGRKR